jgi:hypothetical protein
MCNDWKDHPVFNKFFQLVNLSSANTQVYTQLHFTASSKRFSFELEFLNDNLYELVSEFLEPIH